LERTRGPHGKTKIHKGSLLKMRKRDNLEDLRIEEVKINMDLKLTGWEALT
jgi:hypothetical protein